MFYLPSNVNDCICNAAIALKKCALMLNVLEDDYSFSEKPKVNFDTANYEASKLILEYNRLKGFWETAQDYANEAKNLLEHAEGLELGRKEGFTEGIKKK